MNALIVGALIVVVALTIPFLLMWWRVADKWAESEQQRRFKPRAKAKKTRPDATVVRRPDSADRD
ncbi:MAG: hypothetical protein EA378_06195 [Phycisphaerales bacterium]|nr:MAG: hypothetical protein EA378_06195 [Phycisphaerales bacterium]